jgi:AcrR family transcriptional regulator
VLAAERLFVAHGYEETPTEAVLEAADMSRGALYHHFPGKQDLFAAVFEAVSSRAVERTRRKTRGGASPRETLVAGCLAWLAEARRPAVATILLDQGPQVLGWQRARDLENRYSLGLMKRAVQTAVDAGELEVADVELTARVINAALAEIALVRVQPKLAEQAVRQLIRGYSSPLCG